MKTFRDVLHSLPADSVLKHFFDECGFAFSTPVNFSGELDKNCALELIREIEECPDTSLRDTVISKLQRTLALSAANANTAMFDATRGDTEAHEALAACLGMQHRALWLMVHRPDAFEKACEMYSLDSQESKCQQVNLGIRTAILRSLSALKDFQSEIQNFYRRKLSCGDAIEAHVQERSPNVYLAVAHAKDLATVSREFEGSQLRSRVANPSIDMAIEYSALTGVARTLIKGGSNYHTMLAKAFARHLLGQEADPKRLVPPKLYLGALRSGFHSQAAYHDGFVSLQVKSLTVQSPDETLKTKFTAQGRKNGECVTEIISRIFPNDNPLAHQWSIVSACIKLHYAPRQHSGRQRVITVEVTSTGRLNLHKYDDVLRQQLERYLVEAGVLEQGQVLDMHEVETECSDDEE